MGIKSIKINNLLSFNHIIISDIKDINCIVGKNNVGKSNLLKLLKYFYNKLEGERHLPPKLNSNYSTFGTITITYDVSRIYKIVTSKSNKTKFFKHIYSTIFKNNFNHDTFELTLKIHSNDSSEWSTCNYDLSTLYRTKKD